MPYELRRENGKHCVAKKGAKGTMKCYSSRDDAVRYMRALYANVPDATVASLEADVWAMDVPAEADAVVAAAFSAKQRRSLAKEGVAMPDGSFPIRNRSDLMNALHAIGRAKDRAKAVAHIKARAKALGLSKLTENLTAAGAPVSEKVAEAEAKHPGNTAPNQKREQSPLLQAIRALRAGGGKMKKCPMCHGEGMVDAETDSDDDETMTAAGRTFDPSKHPRAPKGVREGGRFVAIANGPGSYTVEDTDTGEVIAETRTAQEAVAIQDDANEADFAQEMKDNPISPAEEQRQYQDLLDRARVVGVPTSLDDPASPATVYELRQAVEAAEASPRGMFRAGAEAAIREGEANGGLDAANAAAARAALDELDKGNLIATDEDYRAALDRLNRAPGSPERSQLNSQLDVVKGLALGKLPRTDVSLLTVNESADVRSPADIRRDFAQATGKDILRTPGYGGIEAEKARRIANLANVGAEGGTRADGPSHMDYSPEDLRATLASPDASLTPAGRANIERTLALYPTSRAGMVNESAVPPESESTIGYDDVGEPVEAPPAQMLLPSGDVRQYGPANVSQVAGLAEGDRIVSKSGKTGRVTAVGQDPYTRDATVWVEYDDGGKASIPWGSMSMPTRVEDEGYGVNYSAPPSSSPAPKKWTVGMSRVGRDQRIDERITVEATSAREAASIAEKQWRAVNRGRFHTVEVREDRSSLTASTTLELAGITASAAGVAPDVPPAEWFENPELDAPTPLTVTPEGRVYGYVAAWGTCHTGIQGRCVTPPESSEGLPYFNLATVRTDQGDVFAGKITMDTGHAPLTAGSRIAASHYDNTGVVAADVRAGQDEHGIWIAGAVRPDLDVNRARALERATVSGDWRRIDGKHEMVGLLAVNVPGFPIPRAQAAVTAAADGSDMVTALVAAGVLCGCDGELDRELDEVVASAVSPVRLAMQGRLAARSVTPMM